MNRISKKITISFFNIETSNDFFGSFISSFVANKEDIESSRILNLREKKHLVKITQQHDVSENTVYPVTVVRERNTWQAKATSTGKISGISLNQGIIGDPYFFFVVPERKLILGFTTGPSGSLRSVAKIVLEQFNDDRSQTIKLNFVPKEKEYSALERLPNSGELHLKIGSSSLADMFEGAPQLIKNIASDALIEHNVQLILNLPFVETEDSMMSKPDVIELVNYFSDHDGCLALLVTGEDNSGNKVRLDFGNTFFNYRTELTTRNKFIDEASSLNILTDALSKYLSEIKSMS